MKMNTIGIIGCSLATLLMLSSCRNNEPVEEVRLRPVVSQVVGLTGSGQSRTFSGTAQTDKIIDLSFRSGGIVTALNMRVGQVVRRGELLAQLDNVQARLAYEQALASLNSAASQMNTAKLGFERVRSLYEKGTSSLSDFENAKNSYRTAEASHESAQRSVAIQEEQMRYGFIYAPESGIIASVNMEIDENVNPGQLVGVLNAGSEMEIVLGLPESVINRVESGGVVGIGFPSLQGQQFSGEITEVSPSADPNTGTYAVRVAVEDPSSEIRSGMTANVTFNFGEQGSGNDLIVPAAAVGEDEKGRFVFLIEPEGEGLGIARKQTVMVGLLTANGFQIQSGLAVGQRIATAGLQTLLDGQQVRIQ